MKDSRVEKTPKEGGGMVESEWRRCRLHPDVNPDSMWACPDCFSALRREVSAHEARVKPLVEALESIAKAYIGKDAGIVARKALEAFRGLAGEGS